jgi:NAD(P)H dehydrogenase (quinone)
MSSKLLVTGASGKLGHAIIAHLLDSLGVPASRIVAVTRKPDAIAELAARGVEVRVGDFDEEAGLPRAFAGADRIVIVSAEDAITPGRRIRQQRAAVAAAKAAGVRHIVYTSMPNPDEASPITFAGDHRGTEEAIIATGLPYTITRVSWYQENLLNSLPNALKSGQWFTSAGDGRVPHVARDDAAAAIAGALASETSDSAVYTLTGPNAHTTEEIAALVTEVTGRPLAVVQVSDEQLAAGLKSAGLPDPVADMIVGLEANTRQGRIDLVTDHVKKLSGREPRSLEVFLAENKAALSI